jgi:hypothetical protein
MFSGTSSLYFLRPATRLGMGSGSHFFVISSVRFDRVSGRRFPDRVCITREWSLFCFAFGLGASVHLSCFDGFLRRVESTGITWCFETYEL